MKLKVLRVSVPALMSMVFQVGSCGILGDLVELGDRMSHMTPQQRIRAYDDFFVAQGRPSQLPPQPMAQSRMDAETARLRQEAELRRQQEEARARQEAEQRRQEEEARARKEEELNRQREEIRAQQEAEVQLRMQELKDLGGDTSILSRFEKGSGNPEEIREYKAALNRADAEIVRLRNESNLNNQNVIDQLTEENQELRGMIEQLMRRIENLEKENRN